MLDFFFYLTVTAFVIVCLFLILLVLIQKGRGGGLASAFGGAGGNTAFGSKTGDVLTWATSVVFGIFLLLAIGLNLLANAKAAGPAPAVPVAGSVAPSATPPQLPNAEVPTTQAAPTAVPTTGPTSVTQ